MAYTKLVQTGSLVEIYEYEKAPAVHMFARVAFGKRKKTRNRPKTETRRVDSIIRASKSFRRLVVGNLPKTTPALLTLTMLDIVDLRTAYKLYRVFGQKVKYHYGRTVDWIVVPEFQKRGAVHFHALVWGLPQYSIRYERELRDIATLWGHGFVDIRPTDGSPRLSSYLAKYMSKAMFDSRLVQHKAYSASRGIMRPVSIASGFAIDVMKEELGINAIHSPESIYVATYDTLWLGSCRYQKYIIS